MDSWGGPVEDRSVPLLFGANLKDAAAGLVLSTPVGLTLVGKLRPHCHHGSHHHLRLSNREYSRRMVVVNSSGTDLSSTGPPHESISGSIRISSLNFYSARLMYFCTTTITQTTESSQVRKNHSNELM
jgi:hypothetical protein